MKPRFDDNDVAKRIEISDEFVNEFWYLKKKKNSSSKLVFNFGLKSFKFEFIF